MERLSYTWIYIVCYFTIMQNIEKMYKKVDEIVQPKDMLHENLATLSTLNSFW